MTAPPLLPTRRRLADLVPDPANDRAHPSEHLAQVRGLMKTFGNVGVILVQKRSGRVIDGHARLQVLLEDGAEDALVYELDVDDEQARVLAIGINRSPELAAWRPEVLTRHLEDLERSGWNLDLTGFGRDDIDRMLNELAQHEEDLDETAGPDDVVRMTKLGDVWTFPSGHRVVCGDATDPRAYELLMQGRKATLVNTDPPYGVALEADGHEKIRNDDLQGDAFLDFLTRFLTSTARHVHDAAAWYVWQADGTRREFDEALDRAGLREIQRLYWLKPNATLGHAAYQNQVEPCVYATKAGHNPSWYGGRAQTTLWTIATKTKEGAAAVVGSGLVVSTGDGREIHITSRPPKGKKARRLRLDDQEVLELAGDDAATNAWQVSRDTRSAHHPTQKPLELAARPMRNHTLPGDIVLDPFLGSGWSLLAAEGTGRLCYGIELDPLRVDRALAWYVQRTGQQPQNQHGEVYPKG